MLNMSILHSERKFREPMNAPRYQRFKPGACFLWSVSRVRSSELRPSGGGEPFMFKFLKFFWVKMFEPAALWSMWRLLKRRALFDTREHQKMKRSSTFLVLRFTGFFRLWYFWGRKCLFKREFWEICLIFSEFLCKNTLRNYVCFGFCAVWCLVSLQKHCLFVYSKVNDLNTYIIYNSLFFKWKERVKICFSLDVKNRYHLN